MVMDSIKRGFSIASKCLGLVGIIFGFNFVWNMITIFMIPSTQVTINAPAAEAAQVSPAAVIVGLLFILASVFFQAGMIGSVRDAVKTAACSLAKFTEYGKKFYLRLLVLGVIITLIIAVFIFIAVMLPAVSGAANNGALTTIAAILGSIVAIVGLLLVLMLVFSPYIAVDEDLGVVESLKKSLDLAKKNFGKVLGTAVMLTLIIFGLSFIIGFISGIITFILPNVGALILNGLLGSILNAYVGVLMTATFISLYFGVKKLGPGAGVQPPMEGDTEGAA